MKSKSLKLHSILIVALVVAFTSLLCNFNFFAEAEAYAGGVAPYSEKIWDKDEVTTLETLKQVPVEQIMSWDSYDSRKYGIVTPVRNQYNYNLCWSFGSIDAMETALLREQIPLNLPQGVSLTLKQTVLAQATKGFFDDPLNLCDVDNPTNFGETVVANQSVWDVGGNIPVVSLVASRWYGIYNYSHNYIADGKAIEGYSPYRMEKAVTCENNVTQIKELLATYGNVAFAYYASNLSGTYYYAPYSGANHVSSIVGWDDNISAETFRNKGFSQVNKDGAWIVKNSWGTSYHDKGYYYLSYQSYLTELTAFDMMGADDYDYNYNYSGTAPSITLAQYDGRYNYGGHNDYIAVYQAQNGNDSSTEYLKGVSVGVKGQNVVADIKVYTNINVNDIENFDPNATKPATEVTKTFKYEGIYTVELPDMVEVAKDEYYLIYVNLNFGSGIIYERNASYLSDNDLTFFNSGTNWVNFKEALDNNKVRTYGVAAIKGLTVVEDDSRTNVADCTVTLNQSTFTYNGSAHTPLPTVKFDGKTLVEGQDYSVSYEENVNAGQGVVKIVGKGEYRGTVRQSFTIDKADKPTFSGQLNIEIDSEIVSTLKEIQLPTNWEWQDGNLAITEGMRAVAVYNGEDKENYNNIETIITVTIKAKEEQPPEPDDGNETEGETPGESETPSDSQKPNDSSKPDSSKTEPQEEPDNGADDKPVDLGVAIISGVGATVVVVGIVGLVIHIRRKKIS